MVRLTPEELLPFGPLSTRDSIVRVNVGVRWPWARLGWVWAGWAAFSLLLTGPAFLWHVEYFRSPGQAFYYAVLALLPALGVACWAYSHFRPSLFQSMEPVGFALLVLIPCAAYQPRGLLVALLMVVSACAFGGLLLERISGEPSGGQWSPFERLLLSIGSGLALLISALFAVGILGLYTLPIYLALLAVPIVAGRRALRSSLRDLRAFAHTWANDASLSRPLVGIGVFFAATSLAIVLMLLLAPSVAHDPLMMHLPAARHFVAEQGLVAMPFQVYSYYPQGVEILMAVAYALGGQAAAQFIHPMFLGLTLGAVWVIGRRIGVSRAACFLTMATLLATPVLLWTGSVPKNDLAVAAFQLLALGCGLGTPKLSRLRLGVFFLASSAVVKYTAFFGAPWIGLLLLYQLVVDQRGDSWRKVREVVVWLTIAVAVAGCWQIRAYLLTGNPLFPAEFSRLVGHVAPELGTGPRWYGPNHLEIPWFVHFTGQRAFQSPSANPLGFFLLLSLPVWTLLKRRQSSRDVMGLLLVAGCYYLLWGSVYPFLRYAIVPLAIVMLLAWERFESLAGVAPRFQRLVAAMAAYNFAFCLLPAMIISLNGPQLLLFSGQIDEDEYLRRLVPPYQALEYLRQEAGPDDLILGAWMTTAGYAPNAGSFHPMFFRDEAEAELATEALSKRSYRFIIAPDTVGGRAIIDKVPRGYSSTLAYEDGKAVVFRLDRDSNSGG